MIKLYKNRIPAMLKISLINPQGHVRWENPPIASHPDTGGQIVYILELAKELCKIGCRVDIFTRYFKDIEWPGYDKEIEEKNKDLRIVRIKCGPEDKFLKKEDLWPVISDFSAGIKNFYLNEGYYPDILTSHYADAGLAAAILKNTMKIPFVHTGHSLGGKKMDNLKLSGSNFETINNNFKFHLRIAAERISFRNSHAIIASTEEEVKVQYGHRVYDGAIKNDSLISMKFNIIPPGISPEQFFYYRTIEKDGQRYTKAIEKLKAVLRRDISPNRIALPCIFSAARFDAKKNPAGLLSAYASSENLQSSVNIMIIAGSVADPLNPENRLKFADHERIIIEDITEIIKNNNLAGKVCLSRGFDFANEMPYIYRYAGRNKWIFVNPAIHEPFGLTIIEAMATGVPVVSTKHGGPSEILSGGKYGVLVDSTDRDSLREGLEKLLNTDIWNSFSEKGIERVREKFTWKAAAKGYKELFERIMKEDIITKDDFNIPLYFTNPEKNNEVELIRELRKLYFV